MMKNLLALSIASLGLSAMGHANLYKWQLPANADQNRNGGVVRSAEASYDSNTQDLSYSATFGTAPNGLKTEGFWLVVNDGPNPKGIAGELAIFYFDASRSTPVLTAYGYNGLNGNTSFRDGSPAGGTQTPDRIASSKVSSSWINSLQVRNNANGTRTMSFNIRGSVVNNYSPQNGNPSEWRGAQFGEKFGIWFHPVTGLNAQYDQRGFLTKWEYCSEGWIDRTNDNTEVVPEPASITALAIGAVAALRRKKARK